MKTILMMVALAACSSPDTTATRAKNAVDVATYKTALDDCLARGRAAKSFDVYESCAKEADAKYGLDGGTR